MFSTAALAEPSQPSAAAITPALRAAPLEALFGTIQRACGDAPSARAFLSALRVELSSADFSGGPPPDVQIAACDTDGGTFSLKLSPVTTPPTTRPETTARPEALGREYLLDVSDVPRAGRARTLAVAVAETLRLPIADEIPNETQPSAEPALVSPKLTSPRARRLGPASPRVTPPPRRTRDAGVVSRGRWRLPLTGRAVVLGPLHTLALGANVGVSRAIASLARVEGSIGYLTSGNESIFGTARLHALSAEGVVDVQVFAPSAHSEITVGGNASVYGIHVTAFSAWGYDEPSEQGFFAAWGLHASLATALSPHLRTALRVGLVKDLVGLRVKAGGQELMSLYGFGADLRLGVAYAW